MKKTADIRNLCLEHGFTVSDYNSNNGWGFGGLYGEEFKNNTYRILIGKACYRHIKSENVIVVYKNGGRIIDEFDTTKNITNVYEFLKKELENV